MTPKELLQQCLCAKWGGACGLDIPTVRDLLAMALTQDPVTGCGAMSVTLPPIPVRDGLALDCAGGTTVAPVKDEAATPMFFVGTGTPIPVCITNPAPDYTVLLTAIKTAVESIDTKSDNLALIQASVDGLEALVSTGNATLTSILTATQSILVEAQNIDANTDTLEALLNTMTAVLQTESDQTQVAIGTTNTELATANTTLNALLAKLNETCAGNPIKVEVCNPTADPIDYTVLLTDIKTELQGINSDTDNLAPILAAVDGLEALITTGNATASSILTATNAILVEAQAINANTDTLEALIATTNATLQAEFDQTQVILNDIKTTLQAPCGATAQNVNVCNQNAVQINSITPERFVGDNGNFIGYLNTDATGNATNWIVLEGNAPSSVNAVASSEYGYSFTADTVTGQTLNDFMVANGGSSYNPAKILSITIFHDDDNRDLVFNGLRGAAKTVLRAGRARSMTWGDGQSYTMKDKFFGEFTFQSDATVTINFEQGEI